MTSTTDTILRTKILALYKKGHNAVEISEMLEIPFAYVAWELKYLEGLKIYD